MLRQRPESVVLKHRVAEIRVFLLVQRKNLAFPPCSTALLSSPQGFTRENASLDYLQHSLHCTRGIICLLQPLANP